VGGDVFRGGFGRRDRGAFLTKEKDRERAGSEKSALTRVNHSKKKGGAIWKRELDILKNLQSYH